MKKPSVLCIQTLFLTSALLGTTQLASAATDTWTGNTDQYWATALNWSDANNAAPVAGDSLIFGAAGSSGTSLNNNLATVPMPIEGITFSGPSSFSFSGSAVLLTGQANLNTIAILNSSSVAQTFGMPLVLDGGYYTFSSASPGSLALNGGLTLSTGGVAYFDPNVTSSLGNDSSGLISGLGGAGLTYSGSGSTFTGLAAMSGTSIVSYSGWPSVVGAAGSIGALTSAGAVNIELTATAAGNYPFTNNPAITYANTIFLSAASAATLVLGNTAGAQTLDLGAVSGIGGIYLPAGNTAQAVTIGSGASTILTAGPETGTATPGTIVFAINGTSSANQAELNASIQDNGSGGKVSVIKTGTGSMYFANLSSEANNTYSGGTFVDQGLLQSSHAGGTFGSGPVYVASGATLYLANGAATFANNIYLSPGQGAVYSGNALETGVYPGALLITASDTLSGTITLLGAPVAYSTGPAAADPGDRIAANTASISVILSGQITGPGTLELNGSHTWTLTLNNPNTSGPSANNWTGGVILDALTGHAINLDLKMGANNQMGPGNVTLAAPNSATTQYARFDLNGTSQTIGALIGTGNETQLNQVGNFGSGAATLTLGANNGSGTFTGNTSDSSGASIAFIKIGTGTQTFDASSGGTFNYHGNTTVNNGTFALTGGISIPNTAVITVASGAIFDVSNLGNFTVGASPAQTLNCVGTVNGNLTINGTIKALDNIGTLTETGSMTLNGGGTYVWDINNATGTAGSDPGWSWLNISGTLTLNASGQFNINVNSLNGETAGNALNFNPLIAQSWIIATAAGGISGYTGPAQFNVVHSAFSNYAGGSWNVSVDITGDNLLLNYNPFNPIVSLTPAALTINQGQNAVFTATANSLGTSPSFTWTQGATTLTPPSGTTAGGGSYTIATSNGGYTSTLTIDDVDAPPNWPTTTDTSTISATVNETYASSPQVGTLSASLTVIDPPINPNVTQSEIAVPVSAGAVNILTSSASGTQPFTYQWYLNGNQINGATGSTFDVNISPTTVGSYTVVIGNAAGNVTSSATDITGPVSVVPNQIIFEPFNYPDQSHNPSPPQPAWDAFGVTNLFNQATGVGLAWVDAGNVDFGTQPAYQLADPYTVSPYGIGTRPIVNDEYPVYGLAGNDVSAIYADSDVNGGQVNLPFGTAITSGTVYGSFVVMLWGMNQAGATTDYLCGFDSGANNSTTHSLGLYVQDNTPATFPNVPYTLGIFKGNLTTSGLSPGSNGNWSPNTFLDYNVLFVVFRLNFNNSPATCDLWINPPASSFYASEANLPTADVANAASGVADVAGGVSSFFMKITTWPVDRLFGDVRIGTTWASVTPPSAPTLSLANQILANSPGTVVFASQNAGNPVSGNYQWSFDNGSGPVTLSDTTLGDGAVVSGSLTATLTIVGATAAELGTYTVTGSNTDPSPGGGSATLTGSASALLTAKRPALSIFNNSPNIIVSWATNWPVALEATTSLAPPITWGPVVGGESSFLDWPPGSGALAWAPVSPKTISGTNYTVTVAASSGPMFFRLAPSP